MLGEVLGQVPDAPVRVLGSGEHALGVEPDPEPGHMPRLILIGDAYLARHGLDDRISLVVARTSHDPALLKPSPLLITQAVQALDAEPAECTLVGDSVTDIQGARLAGTQSIGYANKPGKPERLSGAGASAIINSLADLALKIRARVDDPCADPELLQLSLGLQGRIFGAPGLTAPAMCSEDGREQPRG
jgi:hypothetical protein